MATLTVTAAGKYVSITDSSNHTVYLPVSGIVRLDAISKDGDPRVVFNDHDIQYQRFVRYILHMKDIITFNASGNFTPESIATTIIALLP